MVIWKIKSRGYPEIVNPDNIKGPQAKPLRYYCSKCECYHWIYSNIGNEHRDYNIRGGK